jgi:hypothetical protein
MTNEKSPVDVSRKYSGDAADRMMRQVPWNAAENPRHDADVG